MLAAKRWGCRRTSWLSTTRLRRTTARSGYLATRPFGTSRANWSRPCAATSRSTGRYARTSAPNSGCWSSASSENMAIRRTNRKRRRGPCSNKRRCCPSAGPPEAVSEDHCHEGEGKRSPHPNPLPVAGEGVKMGIFILTPGSIPDGAIIRRGCSGIGRGVRRAFPRPCPGRRARRRSGSHRDISDAVRPFPREFHIPSASRPG